MRAILVREFGPYHTHAIERVADPVPGDHEVLVYVKAIGVNFPDNLMLEGKYQTRPERPFVPGRDASGIVARIGRGVTRVKEGDRVCVQVATGAFAEQVVAAEARCFPMPQQMSHVDGAVMVTPYNTAYVAVVIRGQIKPGETVLVTGASGGVGLAIIELAKAKGATVIAAVSSAAKFEIVRQAGAAHIVDLSQGELKESLRAQVFAVTGGRGVEAAFDMVGGAVFEAAMRSLRFAGRMIIVGFASGTISEIKGHYVLLKNLSVIGAPLDIHFKETPQLMDAGVREIYALYGKGLLKPHVTATFPLEQFKDAFKLVSTRGVTGKIALTVD